MNVPTVDQVLSATSTGRGWHCWDIEGGAITVATAELRPLLEQAYDPCMPDWAGLVDFDDDGAWHVA
jgi:hypothetical protein